MVAVVVVVLAVGAGPAGAHASLVAVDPQEGGVYDEAPNAVTLRFTEPVEIVLGSVRVFDGLGDRIDAGTPTHPGGRGTEVRSSLPDLDDGTYVVTWRVTSADAHPIEGAYTFQVGPDATVGNAQGLAARLLSAQGGSSTVGVLYAIVRGLGFVALALLIGGALFVVAIFPLGRRVRRARTVVSTGWLLAVITTLAAIGLEGAYVAGLGIGDALDPSVWSDVTSTRFGEVALARLALLVLASAVLVVLFRLGGTARVPRVALAAAAVLAVALSATPGLAGHASTGDHVALAVVSDTLHVLAMSCWLGGLVMLVALVLVRPLPSPARVVHGAVNRFSALALGCVAVLVVTGAFQSWRQVGSLEALRTTDFGRILLVKLVVFAGLVVAAAFSREIVNRSFRDPVDRVPVALAPKAVLVGAPPGGAGGVDPPDVDPPDGDLAVEETRDEAEARRLRRSVRIEVALAVVVLAVTAVLVNTAPARTASTEPVELTMRSDGVFADVLVTPAVAGRNDIHVTVLPTGAETVTGMQMQLTRPGEDLPPFDVPLRSLGPGHESALAFDIPYPGDWRLVLRVQLGATDSVVLTDDFTVR